MAMRSPEMKNPSRCRLERLEAAALLDALQSAFARFQSQHRAGVERTGARILGKQNRTGDGRRHEFTGHDLDEMRLHVPSRQQAQLAMILRTE